MSQVFKFRARVLVHHERPYDFDEHRGLWIYKTVGEDELAGNLVTDAGRVAIHTYIYGTPAQRTSVGLSGSGFNYIGLSSNGTAAAAGDTSLVGELASSGLGRVLGSVTLPTGAGTQTTVSKTFTYTGTSQVVQKTALFDALSGGKMAHEIVFTPRTLLTSDTLSLTFTLILA